MKPNSKSDAKSFKEVTEDMIYEPLKDEEFYIKRIGLSVDSKN